MQLKVRIAIHVICLLLNHSKLFYCLVVVLVPLDGRCTFVVRGWVKYIGHWIPSHLFLHVLHSGKGHCQITCTCRVVPWC